MQENKNCQQGNEEGSQPAVQEETKAKAAHQTQKALKLSEASKAIGKQQQSRQLPNHLLAEIFSTVHPPKADCHVTSLGDFDRQWSAHRQEWNRAIGVLQSCQIARKFAGPVFERQRAENAHKMIRCFVKAYVADEIQICSNF